MRPNLKGVVILVVEDDADARAMVKQVLENHGASVVEAGNGVEALRIVEKSPPHVLLSDLGMPEMDGYTLIKKVRELKPDIPAAAVTAFTDAEALRESIVAGYRIVITKPVDMKYLVKAVASLAGRAA